MKNKNIKKKIKRESSICSLPRDLLEEVLLDVLYESPSPIEDIRCFRKICKKFYGISSSRRIGKYMNVDDWSMHWHDKQGYLEFLQNCAENENTNALFLLGLEEMFNRGRFQIGFEHLQSAVQQGHIFSKYVMGLLLFCEESSRSQGIELLNEISNRDNNKNNTYQCRRKTSKYIRTMTWQKWPSLSVKRCEGFSCGAPSTGECDNQWLREECIKRNFCSDVCKWAHEYEMFANMRYLSA